jgi:hypothetical protein
VNTDVDADGVALAGGRTSGARRVGASVRKPRTTSTPAVHALLAHLDAAGFDGAPRPRWFDAECQDLTFLPGDTVGEVRPWPEWVWSDSLLGDVGSWMRRLHDHTAAYTPPTDAVWFSGHSWRPGLVIGHQDAAPWNVVTRKGRLAGFVDWDAAGPSSRERDLAFSALTWVPLFTPAFAGTLGHTDTEGRARRLHLLLDAYGYDGDRVRFPAHVADRARLQATIIRRLAGTGNPTYVAMEPLATEFDDVAAHLTSTTDETFGTT